MEPLSIPIIFLLGGMTGLLSIAISFWLTRNKELRLLKKTYIFIQTFILCSVTALLGGILFVTLLSLSHG